MKKSTILIVTIVFVVSVLVVGIFGLKSQSFRPTVNVDKITINRVECSTNADGEPLEIHGDASTTATIYVTNYREGMTVSVELLYSPTENTTQKALNTSISKYTLNDETGKYVDKKGNDVAAIERTTITIYKRVNLTVQFKVQDSNGATVTLNIYFMD